ncbi:hypothetical protein C1N32_02885 [Vibrio diazotrophicus]|uniref:Uncharacterized protein n=1 Tax=Vibrio diazotrophicus TaxID=685 RepID=A0A2J8I5Z5_VIBDI|nr:hypothetical protein C1N32_02885 [Vibrio diazotrophicus]
MTFLLEAAAVLTTFVHPNCIVIYAHGDSLTCRLPATPSRLGIIRVGGYIGIKLIGCFLSHYL